MDMHTEEHKDHFLLIFTIFTFFFLIGAVLLGSLLIYVAVASMRNYKDGIHNPVALYKKYAAIWKKTIEWTEINRTALTVVITACIIIFIVYSKGAVGKMFFIWNFILSSIVLSRVPRP